MKTLISHLNPMIVLIQVNDGLYVPFRSSLAKDLFVNSHQSGTYELHPNFAIVHKYLVVDTEGTGFILSKEGVTYEEAEILVKHYL